MTSSLPSLNALRAFDSTARTLSMTAAAQQLHVTHGAVSRQIRQLEEQLGVVLFERAGRGVRLTTAGIRLANTTQQVFSQLEQTCDQLRREAEGAPFVLGCSGSFLARWFIPRLDQLKRDCPELELHLTASDEDQPLRPGVDAALRFATPPWPTNSQVIELAPERIGPVLRPDLLSDADPATPTTLLQLPLLETLSRPQAWPQWCHQQNLEPASLRIAQSFEHLNYMLEAALVGLGVAIAPAYLVEEDLRAGRLIAPWGFIETDALLSLWLPQTAQDPRARQLAEWLRHMLNQ
ncbi:LysR family transcriptional regulator [Marinobacterium sediminicola]|uniref:DNA-binding transcriptional regulator, LysR family n=1 Tax=Marinobacterium sediminicola TaxID=518898 RepID=A0ABY1RW40_9GAMM|nr:LysR family transcriptional regulator [Marinobacterium sediminicola]ULG70446.1 LysR family transcriptional regulator [Marinobacterium sediminicola]SMR69315.1 DNA-binding transcriptional regulator, LysR family [Marinobacterium sediminicola]